jgi:hypothetical protein
MNLESVAVKERSNISPFTLSSIVAAPTVIDTISQSYLQQFNIQQFGVPYKVTDNGSCLCNSVPLALCGREDLATELRVRTCIEIRT